MVGDAGEDTGYLSEIFVGFGPGVEGSGGRGVAKVMVDEQEICEIWTMNPTVAILLHQFLQHQGLLHQYHQTAPPSCPSVASYPLPDFSAFPAFRFCPFPLFIQLFQDHLI